MPREDHLFMWLTLVGKIPIWEHLSKFLGCGPSCCALCNVDEETISHIFVKCTYMQDMWKYITVVTVVPFIWDGYYGIKESLYQWLTNSTFHDYKALPLLMVWGA